MMEVEDSVEEIEMTEVVPQSIELPYDILLHIFDYLSDGSRRQARLVCKKWWQACDDRRFRKNETFFFNASYSFPEIVKVIVDSGRESVNLKLQSYVLDERSNCLWETCGSKITSLKLASCLFDELILGHIIFSCPNMIELSINGGSDKSGRLPSDATFLGTKFKHAEEGTLKREKLVRLAFEARSMPIVYSDLERIHSYFPNLKSLSICLCTKHTSKKRKDLSHFRALLALLSTQTSKIDTLYINFCDDGLSSVLNIKCMADYNLSKLKDVGMRFDQCALNDDSLRTILRYEFWTSLHISANKTTQERFTEFLIKVLQRCPLLKCFGTYWKISKAAHFYDAFPVMANSRLERLDLEIDDRTMSRGPMEPDDVPPPELPVDDLTLPGSLEIYFPQAKHRFNKNMPKNYTVRHLTVNCHKTCYGSISSIFLKHFPKVQHLKLTSGPMENAFKHLPNLLSAEVGDFVSCNRQYFRDPRTSIPNLQYMNIKIFSFEKFSRYKNSDIMFPDLKFLTLTLSSEELNRMDGFAELDCYMEDFCNEFYGADSFSWRIASISSLVTRTATNLRGFAFNFSNLNYFDLNCETGDCNRDAITEFFESCSKLQQLRYIGVQVKDCPKIGKEFCKTLMIESYKAIPSLRAAYCRADKETVASFFNILTKEVEFKEDIIDPLGVNIDMMDYLLACRW